MASSNPQHDARLALLERSLELGGQVLVSCDSELRVLETHGDAEALFVDGALAPPLAEAVRAWRAGGPWRSTRISAGSELGLFQIDEAPGRLLLWLRRATLARPAFGRLLRERYGFKLRSQQLLLLLAQGLRNREIAAQLGLREGTVKTYLHEVYETLGVRSRTAALAELRRTLYAEQP